MPDAASGAKVGSVYLDLLFRDTVNKQVQALAGKAQTSARRQFADVGKAAGSAMAGAFNKSAALIQARIKDLERSFDRASAQLDAMWSRGARPGNAGFDRLAAQQQKMTDQMAYLRDRLAIEAQAAAQKQVAAEQAAYAQTARAAEQAAARQQAAARTAHTTAAPPAAGGQLLGTYADGLLSGGLQNRLTRFNEAVTGSFAGAATAAQRAGERTQSGWSRAFTAIRAAGQKAFSLLTRAAGSLLGRLGGIGKQFTGLTAGVGRFARRLGSIVSGALVFNLISAGLTRMVSALGAAMSSTGQMQQALANLKGAAATAAAPLIQVLTPALSALANAAATVFSYISRLVSFLTGQSVSAMASAAKGMAGVGSAASGTADAVKKATKSLAGFDEIERLDAPQEDSSGGGGGGASTITPNYDFQGKSPFLDSILAAIQAGNWSQVGALVAQKLNESMAAINWPSIDQKAIQWATNLYTGLNGFVQTLNWGLLGNTIGNGLNTALHFIDTYFQGFDWDMLGRGLGTGLSNLVATVDWEALGRVLSDKFKALLETLHGFVATFDFSALGQALATSTMAAFNNIDWAQAAGDASRFTVGVLQMLIAWVQGIDWAALGQTILQCLQSIDWAGIVRSIFTLLGSLIGAAVQLIVPALTSVRDWLASYFTDMGDNAIAGFLNGMWNLLCDIGSWIKTNMIDPLVNAVKDLLGIHSPSTVFADIGQNLVLGLLEGVSGIWGRITNFFATSLDSIKQKFSDTWNAVKNGVSGAFTSIRDTAASIWRNGIVETVRGAVNSILGFINRMISGIANGLNGAIDALNSLSFDMPDWLGGGHFGFNIGHVPVRQIPLLADGGVIRQPTLAMMGEYAGAGSNPEIAAPQSAISEAVAAANTDVVDAVLTAAQQIIDAIRDNGGIVIGDEVIGRAAQRYNNRRAIITGGRL